MSVTGSISSAAGTINITVDVTLTATVDILDVGDISYMFDINDTTSDSLSEVPQYGGSVEITVWDELSDGSSMADDVLFVSRNIELNIGGDPFPCRYRLGEFTIDDIGNVTTFKCYPSNLYNLSPTSGTPNSVYDGNTTHDVIVIGEAIEEALYQYGDNSQSIILDTPHFSDTTSPLDGTSVWGVDTSEFLPRPFLRKLSKVDGAIWGAAFDTGFYVDRGSTSNKVTLTQDNILDINRTPNYPDLNTVEINLNNNGTNFLNGNFDVQDSSIIDADARQNLTVDQTIVELISYYYDTGDSRFESNTNADSDVDALAVTDDGIINLTNALRGEGPFEVEVTVNGFDTIKPWQPFDITDTTGELDQFTGSTYRPSEITYSINNEIRIKGYKIA